MILVIGGYAQGKRDWVKEQYPETDLVLDGTLETGSAPGSRIVVDRLHRWVAEKMKGQTAEEWGAGLEEDLRRFAEQYPDCIFICDEVGNGLVPVDTFQRAYREQMGRLQVSLAREAESVVRVVCGIGQKIK